MKLLQTEQMAVETIPPTASCGYRRYPPSILLIATRTSQTLKIKQALETKECQVCWTEASSEGLGRASQKYFDLIVLVIDQSAENDLAVYQKLKRYPELADIPIMILTTRDTPGKSVNEFKKGPVYFLTKDPWAGEMLWQMIEQVQYLTYRYLA